jgi:hypothetical protein
MYYTGIDPFTKQEVYIAKGLRDRKRQRALMQFFKPANRFTAREALMQAVRQDLTGGSCECLIAGNPPRDAVQARRQKPNPQVRGEEVDGDHYHTVPIQEGVRQVGSAVGTRDAGRAESRRHHRIRVRDRMRTKRRQPEKPQRKT